MIGTIRDMTFDAKGKAILSLTLSADFREEYDRLRDKQLDISIKEYKPKRSGEANRYMWALCEKIAISQGCKKEEVYRKNVREVGVYMPITIAEKAFERFDREWRSRGVGWFCDKVDDSIPGEIEIFAYFGSSTYDRGEMARLINSIIEDAKALGVPTETPAELALLLNN